MLPSRMYATSCNITTLLLTVTHANSDGADTCALEPWESGPWGALLEDWATSPRERTGRIMVLPATRGYYVTDRIGLAPPPPPPSSYEEWHMTPPPPPSPGKILNRPPNPYKDQFKPSPQYPIPQGPPPSIPQPPQHPPPQQTLDQRPQQTDYRPTQDYRPQQLQTDQRPPTQDQRPQQLQTDQRPQQTDYRPPTQDHRPQQLQTDQRPQQTDYRPPTQDHRPQQLQTDQRPPKPDQRPQNFKPNKKPQKPNSVDRIDNPPQRKEVSETDLYLLGAIEKLVYRVDLMEKRLRKMEESMHYLVAGKDKLPEPCMTNFTRVGSLCYHFAPEALDWKTANLACRKMRSNLLELETDKERLKFTAGLLGDKKLRDLDWWTGGLNPGLLWIWSNSARQILTNSTTSAGVASSATSDVTIVGDGRCLALVYDAARKGYVYRGQDCALRHRYVCEKEEDKAKLSNEIERVAKSLRLVESRARKSKILWTDDEQPM